MIHCNIFSIMQQIGDSSIAPSKRNTKFQSGMLRSNKKAHFMSWDGIMSIELR